MSLGVSLSLGALCLAAELSIGVAPFTALGLDEGQAAELRQVALDRIVASQRRGVRLVPAQAVDSAIAELGLSGEALRTCLLEGECAARVALRARADQLLVGSAAGLGRTYVLRLDLVDARHATVDQQVQQTIEGGPADLSAALDDQVGRLLGPPPWYRRWWVWTVIGAALAVVAAAVVTAVLLWPEDQSGTVYPLP